MSSALETGNRPTDSERDRQAASYGTERPRSTSTADPISEESDVGLHHDPNQLRKQSSRGPPEETAGLGCVAPKIVDLRRTVVAGVDVSKLLPVADARDMECLLEEFANSVRFSCCSNEISGFGVLESLTWMTC